MVKPEEVELLNYGKTEEEVEMHVACTKKG